MLVYDGDCGMCTKCANWATRRLPDTAEVVAWQFVDDLGSLGLTQRDVETAAYWVDPGPQTHRGHRAVAKTLMAIGGGWRAIGRLLLLPPVSWVAAGIYLIVARNRHRLPGGTKACRVDPDSRHR